MGVEIRDDCIYYRGDRPCRYNRLCDGCEDYAPAPHRILIIKTAAAGDVLRTTSILPALKKKYPEHFITWLTAADAAPLLRNNPNINKIITMNPLVHPTLMCMTFNLIICLDKEKEVCSLATSHPTEEIAGVVLSPFGVPVPADERAEYYFSLGLSDDLKFIKNKKTYHELIAEVAGLEYCGEKPELYLTDNETQYGHKIVEKLVGGDGVVLGINTGAGGRFAPKMMKMEKIVELVRLLHERLPDVKTLLLGGPDEEQKNQQIEKLTGGAARDAGCRHPIRQFAGIVAQCQCIITGDTLALHIATALGVPTIALFGPTVHQEIDLFGRGEKILSPVDCSPCYRRRCDEKPYCMDLINMEEIYDAVFKLVGSR
ncbi:MAG: glycosyltransferase family 9 protein [bacterium]